MISLRSNHRPKRENVVPMINVAFLLLVFFLLSATFVATPPFEVSPPEAAAEELPDGVDVYLSETQELLTGDGVLAESAGVRGAKVRLHVSGDTAGASLAKSLSSLAALGAENVVLVVRPRDR